MFHYVFDRLNIMLRKYSVHVKNKIRNVHQPDMQG